MCPALWASPRPGPTQRTQRVLLMRETPSVGDGAVHNQEENVSFFTRAYCGGGGYNILMPRQRGEHIGDDPTVITGGFLQQSGNGVGPQILVRADHMSTAVSPPDTKGLQAAKGRRTSLSTLGLKQEILDQGDPRYKAALFQANKYRKARMAELAKLHGHVSSGAGALLASASLALAASRFLYELYAEQSAT